VITIFNRLTAPVF